MGLLQKAVETYEAHSSFVGEESQEHQVLLPVSHILARADLEITLEPEGAFSSARAVDRSEPKIPIPATEESAGAHQRRLCPSSLRPALLSGPLQ